VGRVEVGDAGLPELIQRRSAREYQHYMSFAGDPIMTADQGSTL